jgi:hypothetical protein
MKHLKPTTYDDLTIVYYSSNYLDDRNPHFINNTKRILLESIADTPLISVTQRPTDLGTNICVGNIGRSNRNLYWQILQGAKAAKTKYISTAEDDILYAPDNFAYRPKDDAIAYNMNKWSFFTWSDPLVFSWKKRVVINSMVAPRELFIASMEERFAKHPDYLDEDYCSEPGRYDKALGVKEVKIEEYYAAYPNLVYSHEDAFGYIARGPNKELGPVRGTELVPWGTVQEAMQLYDKDYNPIKCDKCGRYI